MKNVIRIETAKLRKAFPGKRDEEICEAILNESFLHENQFDAISYDWQTFDFETDMVGYMTQLAGFFILRDISFEFTTPGE